jgi:D-alanyl-D-alanine carboxypeptidase
MRQAALAMLVVAATIGGARGEDGAFYGGPYLVLDSASGTVIDHRDALRPWYPASTTKLMTVYVAFQAVAAGEIRLDTEIVYGANAAATPPSKMAFRPGTRLTLDDALKMMMVKSANDIAVAVAEAIAGSVEEFAVRMNRAAEALGMRRSHFVNPHGLADERQVSTAHDMAVLARALLTEFPQHRSYFSIPAIQIGNAVMHNFNTLLARYPGASGMKTGYICASGFNLIASAERDGREVIAVVFGALEEDLRAEEAAALLDEAFAATPDPLAPTLDTVASGAEYAAPLDMRPIVCGEGRQALLEAAEGAAASDPAASSHLGPPTYLGPPVRVAAYAPIAYGEPGFVARLPNRRPDLPGDAPGAGVLGAFAPTGDALGAALPSAEAIDAAAGAVRPLTSVGPGD